jgi:hypothetical protein
MQVLVVFVELVEVVELGDFQSFLNLESLLIEVVEFGVKRIFLLR